MLASKLALNEDQEKTLFLGYISKGLSQREIGKELGIPEYTISRKFKRYGLKKEKDIDSEIKENLLQAKELAQVQNAENAERPIEEKEKIEHITEDFYEKYLIDLATSAEPSAQIANAIRDYLDKKKMLTTKDTSILTDVV